VAAKSSTLSTKLEAMENSCMAKTYEFDGITEFSELTEFL